MNSKIIHFCFEAIIKSRRPANKWKGCNKNWNGLNLEPCSVLLRNPILSHPLLLRMEKTFSGQYDWSDVTHNSKQWLQQQFWTLLGHTVEHVLAMQWQCYITHHNHSNSHIQDIMNWLSFWHSACREDKLWWLLDGTTWQQHATYNN